MIWNKKDPPPEVERTFLQGLGETKESVRLHFSLPIYTLSRGDLPGNAKPAGWHFLATDRRGAAVAGEVRNPPDGSDAGEPITTSLSRGRRIDESLAAYYALGDLPDSEGVSFELRRLRMSPLSIEAFWFKIASSDDKLGEGDLLFPFVAFQDELRFKLVTTSDFLTAAERAITAQDGFYGTLPAGTGA